MWINALFLTGPDEDSLRCLVDLKTSFVIAWIEIGKFSQEGFHCSGQEFSDR